MPNWFTEFIKTDLFKLLLVVVGIVAYLKFAHPQAESAAVKEGLDATVSAQDVAQDTEGAAPTQTVTLDPQLASLLPNYATDDTSKITAETNLQKMNFLTSGFSMPVDTISSSKRIVYNDIRSCPQIVRDDSSVGIWNLSPYVEGAGAFKRKLE